MNISENIQWITSDTTRWKFYTNKSYRAKIQIANPQKIYNVADRPGVVYNCLDDAYEKVVKTGYVVTGIKGEMWPIGKNTLKKYNVAQEDITNEPMEVDTVEIDTVYAAIMIPTEIQFTLEVDYGQKAILRGNRPGIEHGEGDYVLVVAKMKNSVFYPDFDDSGRIINGALFDRLYKEFKA